MPGRCGRPTCAAGGSKPARCPDPARAGVFNPFGRNARASAAVAPARAAAAAACTTGTGSTHCVALEAPTITNKKNELIFLTGSLSKRSASRRHHRSNRTSAAASCATRAVFARRRGHLRAHARPLGHHAQVGDHQLGDGLDSQRQRRARIADQRERHLRRGAPALVRGHRLRRFRRQVRRARQREDFVDGDARVAHQRRLDHAGAIARQQHALVAAAGRRQPHSLAHAHGGDLLVERERRLGVGDCRWARRLAR